MSHPIWKHVPSEIALTYTFKCSICENIVKQEWGGMDLVFPDHPGTGWHEFSPGAWVCPNHAVTICIDGKQIDLYRQ